MKILAAILIAIIQTIIVIMPYWGKVSDKRRNPSNRFTNLGVSLIIFCLLLGGINASIVYLTDREAKIVEGQLAETKDSISNLRRELNSKSETIIALNDSLLRNANDQIKHLTRLSLPIPSHVKTLIEAALVMPSAEVAEIEASLNMQTAPKSNLLPVDFLLDNEGVRRINSLKDIYLTLWLEFHNGDKKMTMLLRNTPKYVGYNAESHTNCFTLFFDKEKREIGLHGLFLDITDIQCNYPTPSILDFNTSKVIVKYDFSYPQVLTFGQKQVKSYVSSNRDYMRIKIKKILIYDRHMTTTIEGFTQVDNNTFQTAVNLGL